MFKKLNEILKSFIEAFKLINWKGSQKNKNLDDFNKPRKSDNLRRSKEKKQLSLQEAMLKVSRDPETLRNIDPKFLLNEDLVMLALRKNGHLYSILPDKMKNNIKIARKAYYQTGEILPSFPLEIAEKIRSKKKKSYGKGSY